MTTVMSCDATARADRLRAITARQQAVWASGDFAVIGATLQIAGATLQIVGETLSEAADVRATHHDLARHD